jgi:hypothetical protein
LRAAETKAKKFEAELAKIRRAGTIVLKPFQVFKVFNADLKLDLSFHGNAYQDPSFYINTDLHQPLGPKPPQKSSRLHCERPRPSMALYLVESF